MAITIEGVGELECLSTDAALGKGLVPIGEPVIARDHFELTGFGVGGPVYINPRELPQDAVAYSKGNPIQEQGTNRGYHAFVPIQFFRR